MQELMNGVLDLEEKELERMRANYGHDYASPHEAYGVIAEEIYEGTTESNWVDHLFTGKDHEGKSLQTRLLPSLQNDDTETQKAIYNRIRRCALNCAAEMIQVAGVARKIMESPCMNQEDAENG